MNVWEAAKRACEEPTLLKALSWIAVWESERLVEYVRNHHEEIDNGGQWETCFYICFKLVTEEYAKQGKL